MLQKYYKGLKLKLTMLNIQERELHASLNLSLW